MATGAINKPIASPMFKYKTITLADFTMGNTGFKDIQSQIPSAPDGYKLMFAMMYTWSKIDPSNAITITASGRYVISEPNVKIEGLQIRYFFVLQSDCNSF